MHAATTSQPDLAYSIGILARFLSEPSETHWSRVKRVLGISRDPLTMDWSSQKAETTVWLDIQMQIGLATLITEDQHLDTHTT